MAQHGQYQHCIPRFVLRGFTNADVEIKGIVTAVAGDLGHIDILEKDIHFLYKFMNLSLRCFEQCKGEVESPYRENDFVFQRLFAASEKRGRSGDSGYALPIWKAAAGYEFFLNEHLVDIEGDTEFCLGSEAKGAGFQLIWTTRKDMAHPFLPISPEVAVAFCDESRCWQSPFADSMHKLKIPYPGNSLLWDAPLKDLVNIRAPSEKRSRKAWPAKVARRVIIGALSRHQHQIIASYSLGHADSFAERRNVEEPRNSVWLSTGPGKAQRRTYTSTSVQATRIVDGYMASLSEVINTVGTTREPIPRTEEMAFKSWQAVLALDIVGGPAPSSPVSNGQSIMNPGLRAAFESAYPPKHPDHKDLVAIDFFQFFSEAIGESTFAQLSLQIDDKLSDLVHADSFEAHFGAARKSVQSPTESSFWQGNNHHSEQFSGHEEILENPAFRSIFRAGPGFRRPEMDA
ncbi:hypothetical protein DL770_006763 [Monosporascus sp. CRB-9-2]|nr:hypothetical protein DL770_006763 [Monosporascus sp. CRB-9-2]